MKKHRIIIALLAFSVLLVVPLCALAATETTLMPTVGVNSEVVHPAGEFLVYVATDSEWQEAGRLSFDRYFRQEKLDLGKYISGDGNVRIRLVQNGGEAAHIDAVLLGERSPAEVRGLDDVLALKKVSEQDFDVVDSFQKEVELVFPSGDTDRVLSLTARVEGPRISETPFHYPLGNLYKKMTADSEFYSYRLAGEEVVSTITSKPDMSENPFFKEYSVTGSGHPSGYTYGWVSNDRENLYVTMDFTPDDTMDGDKDYAKLYVKTEDGIREFKVSVPETRWGRPDFTYTDKVAYQHKVYDFAIPLSEIGVADVSKEKELLLAFAAYGTAAPIIEVAKTGDTLSKVGDDVNYTITLSSSWAGDPPLECIAFDSLLGTVFDGALPQGDTVLNLSRTVQEGDPDPLVNIVSLTCTLEDGSAFGVAASHSVNLFQPAVEVIKTGPDIATVGETITYFFTINNLSSADSPDLILVSVTDTVLGDLTGPAAAGGCSTLASGGSCNFTFDYIIQSTDPSPLVNVVTVHFNPFGFPNDLTDDDDHTVTVLKKVACRTAGFWGTHAGEECPGNKPDCGSQNITQDVIDACGGPGEQCLEICGESIFNTDLDSGNSALEALCVSPAGDQALQLARQLTATALNCCISVGEDDCEGIDEWEDIFIFCNSVCALNLTDWFDSCIDTLDCLNKGGIPLVLDNPGFFCQTGICEPVDGDGFVDQVDGGLPCNEDYGCPFGYECIPLSDTCHDRELCNEDLGLCYRKPGPAGSKDACTLAKGDGKGNKAGNDCAILPKLYSDDCSKLNQGEECCTNDSEEACEACGHGVFETGLGLDMFCDPCVTQVCFEDPYCCDDEEGAWDLKCVNEAIDLCSIPCVDSCPGFVETALDNLVIPDVTPPVMTCAEAVDLLNERSIGTPDVVCDGTDRSDDAAYIMVARLIEAEANYINGAPTCGNATDAINQAIALLDALNFDGMSSYLPPSSSYPIELRQYALDLAGVLDAYNNSFLHDTGDCSSVPAPPSDIWTGTVIVQKDMINGIDTFMFTGDVAGSISIDGGTLSDIVLIGETSSTEVLTVDQVNAGWVLTSILCSDGNSTGDTGTATATFRVEAGEIVICTFSNTFPGP